MKDKDIKKEAVVDLFCGAGGLTRGLINVGLNVIAGLDNDLKCEYPYVVNNSSQFFLKDIENVDAAFLNELYCNAEVKILVGCAPCQSFSGLNQKKDLGENMEPLDKFAMLITDVKPDIVSMENVSRLAKKDKHAVFRRFVNTLLKNGYHVDSQVVNASDYGVPQNRHRLVLLASRLGPIKLVPPVGRAVKTVRDAIGSLPVIQDGEQDTQDSLHFTRKLSVLTKKRIEATPKNGGDSRHWPLALKPACHLRKSGKTFRTAVYGRMRWDAPAPTMTTQCIGFGNGRFGHPEQNRAISLREAALIQSFPPTYRFAKNHNYNIGDVAKFIGNAVPVRLAEVIGLTIKKHIDMHARV